MGTDVLRHRLDRGRSRVPRCRGSFGRDRLHARRARVDLRGHRAVRWARTGATFLSGGVRPVETGRSKDMGRLKCFAVAAGIAALTLASPVFAKSQAPD